MVVAVNSEKEKCNCGAIATWCYMPDGGFYCDSHVSRGCSCNWKGKADQVPPPESDNGWKWITDEDRKRQGLDNPLPEKHYWVYLDEKGREYPCCEYEYDKDGFDIDDTPSDILNKMYEKSKDNPVI